MRIGVDGHVLTGKHQGSRTWLSHILAEMDRLPVGDGFWSDEYVVYSDEPTEVTRVTGSSRLTHRRLPRRPPAMRLLVTWPRLSTRDRLDALVTQYNAPLFGAGRQVVVVHDVLFETHPSYFPPWMRRRLQWMTRRSVTKADLVVTVSEYSRAQIARLYHVDDDRLVVCPNGAPQVDVSDPLEDADDAAVGPYVLMVGRIEPRKNVDLVIQATAGIRRDGARLVLVGTPDFGANATLEAIGRAQNVVHLRGVAPERLSKLYRHAHALVFASGGEGFGLPVLEALAHRTPVIASNQTSIPEVGGHLARYFDPIAPDAKEVLSGLVAEALSEKVMLDPAEVSDHLAGFSWRRSAETFVTAVHTALV